MNSEATLGAANLPTRLVAQHSDLGAKRPWQCSNLPTTFGKRDSPFLRIHSKCITSSNNNNNYYLHVSFLDFPSFALKSWKYRLLK